MEIGEPIFNAYDKDKDGILPDSFMQDYFHMVDTNGELISPFPNQSLVQTGINATSRTVLKHTCTPFLYRVFTEESILYMYFKDIQSYLI